MNILLTETINLEQVADLCAVGIQRRPPTPRDLSKWHVSNLIDSAQCIAKGDTRYHEFEGEPSGIMSFGRIWESAVDCYLKQYSVLNGGFYYPDIERVGDDILGSLDGIMILPDLRKLTGIELDIRACMLVCETKLKFSLHGEIPLRDLQQTRAYCHLADTDLVCYVSGHISSTPPTAKAELRIIRFTQQSIEENWSMLVNTRDYLLKCECCPNGG